MVLMPARERLMTAQAYLQELRHRRDRIAAVEFIPPRLGQMGYGLFRVRYNKPVLLSNKPTDGI